MADKVAKPAEPVAPSEPTTVAIDATPSPDPEAVAQAQKQGRINFAQQRYEQAVFKRDSQAPQATTPAMPPLQTESDKLLFGETFRPNEPITAGLNRLRPGSMAPPEEVMRNLDALVTLAGRPDAPPQVQELVAALARELRQ